MIRCITIDDSPLALDLLDDYISKIEYLKLVRRCSSAAEARELLSRQAVDLIFTDIQMPDINGLDFIKSLKTKPKVIFTTAYPHYAIEGFDLDAVDYLLKPFSFERFKKAISKVFQQMELEKRMDDENKCIFVKSGYEVVKISIKEIEYIEALKDYIQIFKKDQKVLTLMSMKAILELLPAGEFGRCHRSYIVPLSKVSRVSSRSVFIGHKEIPIGEMYRDEFQKLLKSRGISP